MVRVPLALLRTFVPSLAAGTVHETEKQMALARIPPRESHAITVPGFGLTATAAGHLVGRKEAGVS